MKKIGVMTFHNTTNYGAILQCYALQKYINEKNNYCEVIDYNNKFLTRNYNINPFVSNSLKTFLKKMIYYIPEWRNKKYFKQFMKKYINVSSDKYNESNINNSDAIYDKFIVGSDQVWNYSLSGEDSNYFLEFCNNKSKKNSYAASFGSSVLPMEHRDTIINMLNKQNNISVREDEIITVLKKIVKNKDITQCIDPVFLLNTNDWNQLIVDRKNAKKKYIFVYEVARTPLLRDFVKELKKKTGMKVIYLSKSGKKMSGVKKLYSVSPFQFLKYIRDAEYVVTSSFHGMAFSVIFEKNFYFDVPNNKNEFGSRLDSLSKICNVGNRKINKEFDNNDFININYNIVNNNLNVAIEKSKEYLKKILEE